MPPEMLSVFGSKRMLRPVGDVTTTRRILPSVPVTTRLTVPMVAPPLPLTVRPVLRPGRTLACTAPRARALLGLARSIDLKDACITPWLLVRADKLALAFNPALLPVRTIACVCAAGVTLTALLVLVRAAAIADVC